MTESVSNPNGVRVFAAPGISCEHCKRAIEDELSGISDVERADVDVDDKLVRVTGSASNEAIVAAIVEAGYDAALVTTQPTSLAAHE